MVPTQASFLQVLRPGPMTTVQDAGRPGRGHLGVPPSGAADRPAWQLANRLVGNPDGAAGLETTLAGPSLVLRGPTARRIAVTGAPAPVWVDGRPAPLYAPVAVLPDQTVKIGPASAGLRSYLAVSGGLVVDRVFGSMSTDLLSGLGPKPLADGACIELGPPVPAAAPGSAGVSNPSARPVLDVVLGPRLDWLEPDAAEALVATWWTVTADSNRVGIRLDGPALEWRSREELPSEGVVTGSIQVPPDGRPVIFGNDHPVTGGYPVVAVLTDAALPTAAQLRPGGAVRFRDIGFRVG